MPFVSSLPYRRFLAAAVLAGFCLLCAGSAPGTGSPPPGAVSAPARADLQAFAGRQVRLVWVQDAGDKSDPFATGGRLRLMALDTAEGGGERVLLPEVGNYAKPLIAPRGDRVVFSDRIRKKVFAVQWDGSGLREVASGFAVSLWQDPATGREWVYYGADENKDEHCPVLFRLPLDAPGGTPEMVWNRTLVSVDGFQVSRNGRLASGNFPWPEGGVAGLPNGELRILAKGCWPCLASDGTPLFWIFDGAHRNLSLFHLRDNRRWQINLSAAPGIRGNEVYHPKWTNSARYLVMTGPYTVGLGANKIAGGGRGVEIYLGRFKTDFSAVEQWIRVTGNDRGDFFPDAWIAPATRAAAPAPSPLPPAPVGEMPPDGEKPLPPVLSAWPGDRAGLAFLWENGAKRNAIPGPNPQNPDVCRVEPRGRAILGRFFDMDTAGGAFVADQNSGDRLLRQCRDAHALTVEALVTPARAPQEGPARIATFSSGASSRNFTLGQAGDRLVFRLRTTETNENGTPPEWDLGPLRAGAPHHVLVSCRPGRLVYYLNGTQAFSTNKRLGDFRTWAPQALLFGDEWDGQRNWAGRLERVALYSRFVSPAEAARKYAWVRKTLAGRKPLPRVVVEARLTEPSAIPAPQDIAPYRRGLLAQGYEVVKVLAGTYREKKIMAAHWVILDGHVLEEARRARGKVYRLALERFDDHPELEGERITMDSDEFTLPLYYEVR